MQGASPLASPRLSRKRHGLNLRNKYPTGGLPFWLPAYPAFSFLACPHPPTPRSQSALPGGKGVTKVNSCKGLRPLHASPRLSRKRHELNLRNKCPMWGFPFWLLAYPAFRFLFCPIPPPLPPRGRGRFLVFLCKGLRPLHPRGLNGRGTDIACGKPVLSASNGALAPAGATETRAAKKPASRKAPVWKDL